MAFRRITPAQDLRSVVHPKIARGILEIYRRMGFKSAEDFDRFWAQINTDPNGNYIPYRHQSDDPRSELIQRALAGERFDTKKIYRDLGYRNP